jgi:aryl-alcohol dehydrogenase-like predicted oxidoreductase
MAYNTLAGGMLTGKYMDRPAALDNDDREKVIEAMENPRGRHDEFGWGRTLYRYRTDAAQDAIRDYNKIAKDAGISLTELSLRWCRQRSLITTSLVGHSNMKQLKDSIEYFTKNDPLPEKVMWEIDVSESLVYKVVDKYSQFKLLLCLQRVHMRNRLPIFSSNRVGKDWFGEGGKVKALRLL